LRAGTSGARVAIPTEILSSLGAFILIICVVNDYERLITQ
jgi:hypothetical protein